MKILVTGGTGFLGKHVQQAFSKSSNELWFPSSKDLNLLDTRASEEAIAYIQPDTILHMAAVCGGILANKNSPADFLHKNLDMASNIFHAARKIGCKNVFTLGSVCAYPKNCRTPFSEYDLWNGYPEETNAPYGIAKRVLLMLGNTYREQYGIGGSHLIPVNMYGEHDHFDLTNSHVIPALIRKFDNAVTNNLPEVECWGTGTATREFLYAGDCSQAIVQAVEDGLTSENPINLGMGKDISIKDLSLLIAELTGYLGNIRFTGEVSDGQPKRLLSVYRAQKLLGWTATTELREGLVRTIRWYRANKQEIIAGDAS
jgi:GDP-L-fucose synthase